MNFINNLQFLNKLDLSIKNILKDGKIDQYDIPEIILLITDLLATESKVSISTPDMLKIINALYEYIMTHYKLLPEDPTQVAAFKRLFDLCIRMVMVQPFIKKNLCCCISN